MMRITAWLAVVAVTLLAACTSEPEIRVRGDRFNDEQLALGEQFYVQNCASCHGVNGEGQFPNAPLQPDATGRLGAPPPTTKPAIPGITEMDCSFVTFLKVVSV